MIKHHCNKPGNFSLFYNYGRLHSYNSHYFILSQYKCLQIANTRAGHYYCQPNSTQAGLLKSSSQTTVFSKPLYVVIDNSCEGQQLSTEQPECILNGNSLSGTTTTELSNSETSAEPTIDPPENHNILYKSLGGVGLLLIVIVVCTGLIVCCHHKRTSRSRVPNSQGKGSRVVRGMLVTHHAVH